MSKYWLTWHRWLGLVTSIGVFLWAASGFCHPIMTHLQPSPIAFSAPAQELNLSHALTPIQVLEKHQIPAVNHINLVTLDDQNYYQMTVNVAHPARYFSIKDGSELADGDQHYAEMLALHFTGRKHDEIASARLITGFDQDYHPVNQLLPVWRIEFKNSPHLRAYIDTRGSRLSTLVDDTRHTLTQVFRIGHNWSFAESHPLLQVSLMATVLSIALLSAGSGIYLYFRYRNSNQQRLKSQPVRRYHRKLGFAIALTTLLFASSGLFHLITSYQREQQPATHLDQPAFLAADFSLPHWQKISQQTVSSLHLVTYQQASAWLVSQSQADTPRAQVAVLKQEGHNHHHAQHHQKPHFEVIAAGTSPENADLETLLNKQAAAYAGLDIEDISDTQWITQFGGEYGFIFKRLPVLRVQFKAKGNPRYFIEPMTGALAARIDDLDGLEGFSFAYLHKWAYQSLNKDVRDAMVMLFALINIIVSVLGMILFSRKLMLHRI